MGIKKIHALFWQQLGRSWLSFDAGFEDTSRSAEGSSQARLRKAAFSAFFLDFILRQPTGYQSSIILVIFDSDLT